MDARQNNFPVPFLRQRFHFPDNILHAPAPYPPPCIRDNAVTAKLVATILHFQESPGMLPCAADAQFFVCPFLSNVPYGYIGMGFLCCSMPKAGTALAFLPLLWGMLLKILFQQCQQFMFPVIPNQNINRPVCLHLLPGGLDIASGRHYCAVWIFLLGTVEHLPGLAVCNIRNGTRIYHIDVGCFPKRDNFIARLLQHLAHAFRFVCVDFTAKVL